MKKLIPVLICLCLSLTAFADVKIVQKVKTSPIMGQPGKDHIVTTLVKGTKMKVQTEGEATYQVIDATAGKAFIVDPTKKEVMVMTTENMKQAAGMLSGLMGGQSAKPVIEKMGTKTINGFKCQEIKATTTGAISATTVSCIAADYDVKEMEPFLSFIQSMTQVIGVDAKEYYQGLPVHSESTINMMGQTITSTSDIVSISRDSLVDSVFNVPSDYKVRELNMPKQK